MAGITKQQAQAKLDEWLAADTAVSQGQSFSKSGRTFTSADAGTIRENIEYWNKQVKRSTRGGIRVMRGIPLG